MSTIFISAGEASGEHYGALLAASIRQQPTPKGERADLIGMGGERMRAAGVECIVRSEDVAVMGLTEVIHHLPRIYREFRKLKKAIRERRPDVAVLIDFPEIHFRLAKLFYQLGIPVIYFVSPQLWAWKKHRIRLVQQYVRKMLVIFPFEEPFYRQHGVQAEFVGHPLAELPMPAVPREEFAAENALDTTRTWIALLPGSRPHEIRDHLPTMLGAAHRLAQLHPLEFEFIIPLAPTLNTPQRAQVYALARNQLVSAPVRLVDDARAALRHARVSVVASGTATVEAALIGNPFVVVYRVSALTYAIAKRIVEVPHVAMANLIAGKRVVPELIQHDFTASNIVEHVERLLPDAAPRQSMMKELGIIRDALAGQPAQQTNQAMRDCVGETVGAIERVAAIVINEIPAAHPVSPELPVRT